jgi:hypothetical protein
MTQKNVHYLNRMNTRLLPIAVLRMVHRGISRQHRNSNLHEWKCERSKIDYIFEVIEY